MVVKYLQLNDISCYKKAFNLSNYVWEVILKWDYFSRKTVGEQYVSAIDSVSANIAKEFGRFGKKEKVRFYRISQGSAKESLDWNEKARVRKLLKNEEYNHIYSELQNLPKEINELIKFTNEKLKD